MEVPLVRAQNLNYKTQKRWYTHTAHSTLYGGETFFIRPRYAVAVGL